jgi:hypothetical protein
MVIALPVIQLVLRRRSSSNTPSDPSNPSEHHDQEAGVR